MPPRKKIKNTQQPVTTGINCMFTVLVHIVTHATVDSQVLEPANVYFEPIGAGE
jgi:hypothetical protein